MIEPFLILTAVSQALVGIVNLISIKLTLRIRRPVRWRLLAVAPVITDATRRLLPDGGFRFEPRAQAAIKGKQIGLAPWAPRARAERGVSAREEVGVRRRARAASVPD